MEWTSIVTSLDNDMLFKLTNWAQVTPPPDFDEDAYLRENSDVAAEVKAGTIASGFEHYVRWGRDEGRHRPGPLARPSREYAAAGQG